MRKTSVYIVIGVVLLVLYFQYRKEPYLEMTTPAPSIKPSSNDLASAFTDLISKYGQPFARKIEQLYRLETGHFGSGQFLEGNSPGMVARKTTYPYGWPSLDQFAKANSIDGHKFGIGRTFVVRGNNFRYVTFPDFRTSLEYVSWFIKNKRGGVVQKWNSLDPVDSARYLNTLNQMRTQYT
jgi:hypothetical protein